MLLAVSDPPADMPWPPKVSVVKNDDINAYATILLEGDEDKPKVQPVVVVFSGLMKKIVLTKDDPDPNSVRTASPTLWGTRYLTCSSSTW